MVYVLAIAAAALFGLGAAVQQRVAAHAPDKTVLRPALLWHLARQPFWLVGVGTALVGNVFAGIALGIGGVALVQPLLVTRLIFALPVAARWNRRRLRRREWLGVIAVVGGLAGFLVAGRPSAGTHTAGNSLRWLITAAAVGVVTFALVVLARRLRPRTEAPVLGAGAGMLFALQSGLMSIAVATLATGGVDAMLAAWPVYAVIGTAVVGTLIAQSAYKLAPLPASYPPLATTEPLAGIAVGVALLGGTLQLQSGAVAIQVAGLVVMTVGVYVLAASPLVTGAHHESGRWTADDATVEAHEEVRGSRGGRNERPRAERPGPQRPGGDPRRDLLGRASSRREVLGRGPSRREVLRRVPSRQEVFRRVLPTPGWARPAVVGDRRGRRRP